MNDAGYRTQKGKLWTYQTLLLEQRRRGESRAQKKIERPIKKVAVVVQKSQRSQKSRANEGLFVKIDPILKVILESTDFHSGVRQALDEGFSPAEIAMGLNELGATDSKGRAWTEASITHEWTQQVTRNAESKNPLDRWGLSEIVDRNPKEDLEGSTEGLKTGRAKKSPEFEEVLTKINLELRKGTKCKTLVGVLNMGGFLTRRGKFWTYQTLNQEINRQKRQNILGENSNMESKAVQKIVTKQESNAGTMDALSYARDFICSELLPKLMERGDKTPKGKTWSYEILLWELLKMGLDVEAFISEKPLKWWTKKKIENDAGAPTIFDVLG